MKFMVLGDAFVDICASSLTSLPQWGGNVDTEEPIRMLPGGSALNVAVHLGALKKPEQEGGDVSVGLHHAVGQDEFANVLNQALHKHNVSSFQSTIPDAQTGVCIVMSGKDDRAFVTHCGATGSFSRKHVNIDALKSADHIHISGYYSCTGLHTEMVDLLQEIRGTSSSDRAEETPTISLDTNYDGTNEWKGVEELFPLIDVFLPNEVEAEGVSGLKELEDIQHYFQNRVPLTVITRGSEGSIAFTATGETFRQQSYAACTVADPTGAGDAFAAGFLYGWKVLKSVEAGLWHGAAAASLNVQHYGACTSPSTLEQIERRIKM